MPDLSVNPESKDAELRFAVASCQYASGLLDKQPAYRSYERLAQSLAGGRPPELLLLVGDQVYIDATAGLFDPTVLADRFHRPYKVLYGEPRVSAIGRRLDGVYCVMDDHELEDNWEPVETPAGIDYGKLRLAVEGYAKWERAQGPACVPGRSPAPPVWYAFDRDPARFFMADTRTERTARNVRLLSGARIMGSEQRDALRTWLEKDANRTIPKVIATPSILLPRRRWARGHEANALRSDAWDGYRASLHELLAFIARKEIGSLFFVSGDEHLSCAARIEIRAIAGPAAGKPNTVIYSIHGSPLYAPFPFANSVEEDLVAADRFEFDDPEVAGTRYECTVDTRFPRIGDGFAVLGLSPAADGWQLCCEFIGHTASVTYSCLPKGWG